ncbi:MAG: hypothetical protein AB4206_14760 [Xenococcaceae cyanobacterium]
MKIDRHGRAKILTQDEIQLLFNSGFTLYDAVKEKDARQEIEADLGKH